VPKRMTPAQREARERFVRAANTRVNNALVEIRKIGKLSSDRYEYGPTDVQAIIGALTEAIDEQRKQLETRTREEPRITVIAE